MVERMRLEREAFPGRKHREDMAMATTSTSDDAGES
jgi:hypothetical protein